MSVSKRPDGKWRARVRVDGVEKAQHFRNKVDAENWEREQRTAVAKGTFIDPANARRTFREIADEWQERQSTWRPSTAALAKNSLERHVYPRIGDRRIGTLRPSDMEALAKALSDDLAATTVITVMRYTSGVFKSAVRDRIIPSSPMMDLRLKQPEQRRIVPLTVEQLDGLEEALPDRLAALVIVGAGLGLRQGEAFALTVDRVDFLRRRVEIDRQIVSPPGKGTTPGFAPLKTLSSRRFVPLPDAVGERLARHIAEHDIAPDALLFTAVAGGPLRRQVFGGTWRSAVNRAAVPTGTGYHDLRHTYASTLISAGVSVRAVAANLGHKDPMVTLRTYAHLMPDDEDRTRSAVAEFLARADQTRTGAAENA